MCGVLCRLFVRGHRIPWGIDKLGKEEADREE